MVVERETTRPGFRIHRGSGVGSLSRVSVDPICAYAFTQLLLLLLPLPFFFSYLAKHISNRRYPASIPTIAFSPVFFLSMLPPTQRASLALALPILSSLFAPLPGPLLPSLFISPLLLLLRRDLLLLVHLALPLLPPQPHLLLHPLQPQV